MADYYDILGVSRSADEKEIRQAYRRLARQHHPDVNPGDDAAAERFKTINAAYEVLSDADKRGKYDRYGDRWEQAEHFEQQGGPDFSQFFHGGNFSGGGPGGFTFSTGGATLSDLLGGLGGFGSDLGGGRGERFRSRPADVPVEITLEEADRGATRLVNLPDGRRLEVKIPAGIADGGRVHIAAGSSAGGEFNLLVTVLPHGQFERNGDDLTTTVDVPLLDAVLGGTGDGEDAAGADRVDAAAGDAEWPPVPAGRPGHGEAQRPGAAGQPLRRDQCVAAHQPDRRAASVCSSNCGRLPSIPAFAGMTVVDGKELTVVDDKERTR